LNKIAKICISILVILFYYWWQELLYHYITDKYFPQPKISQSNIDVQLYDIDIKLFPTKKLISSKVTIKFTREIDSKYLILDFEDGFRIKSLKLNNNLIDYKYKDDALVVKVLSDIPDTSKIEITYSGYPSQAKMFGLIFGKEESNDFIYTIDEPSETRSWLPCHDSPSDKAFLDIRITNDSQFVSVSNGNLIDSTQSKNRKTYHWKTVYPLTTYNISIYSSNYYTGKITDKNFRIQYFVPKDILSKARTDFQIVPELLKKNIHDFGNYPFPNEKVGFVVNLWNQGAIENQSIIGIGKELVTGDNSNLSILHHEIAHAWWGNSISVKSWKDIWLNEGFASYAEILFAKQYFQGSQNNFNKLLNYFNEVSYTSPLYNPNGFIFDRFIYEKSARVMMMLSYEIGDSLFRDVIRKYHEYYKYSNSSTMEFKLFLEKSTNKNLDCFFNQWIYNGVGMPVIKYSYEIRKFNSSSSVFLKVDQTQNDFKVYKLKLPVTFLGRPGTNSKSNKIISMDFQMNSRSLVIKQDFDFIVGKVILNQGNKILAKIIRR